jgi:hypothetical protein
MSSTASDREIFRNGGLLQIPNFIDPTLAGELAERALRLVDAHAIQRDAYTRHGGRALHEILDGFAVQEHFPELLVAYAKARETAEDVAGEPVILSPYPRSGVNLRVYRHTNSSDGWHYDSNPVSALLYLTSGGQPTRFKVSEDELLDVCPSTGLLLLFKGRTLLHHVPTGDQLRITCPFNLYYPHDTFRPDYVDGVLFENRDGVSQ